MESRPRACSFHDRLHGNIAHRVMLTQQHRSPKDRESLPYREWVQGERTSVPSSGVDDDPRAIAQRGWMVLCAAETAWWLIARARMLLNSVSEKVSDHSTPRRPAARRALSFNHQR
ncbi:hypothetical protein [Bradyrhizobium sp. WSM3983]|uniref:hypothetical protein n=1 Tax=Bradyrhizobium sp. WSM3983 TaxID=1038867 RepID=UPI0012EBF7F9|nr:hypothetical protein [Bradyrhizobium sp. WSM3983]